MQRFVCVHGHFYQPPRENPWLEAIEQQDSAYPFHDWNERITAECYAPNATARILDQAQQIVRITNNYGRISFNVGPTLLSWMEDHAPETYRAILEADKQSAQRFGGHGAAMAQVYGHLIMPLANRRDQATQVRWGVRDFERRFGRRPEGMWLPETAVDIPSLEALAAEDVKFTVLAPYQAKRVRDLPQAGAQQGPWEDLGPGGVDPSVPYLVRLPSGRSIAVFFYDGPVSHDVAFRGLLADGGRFAQRLFEAFPDEDRDGPALAHIATDGETYGHHHRHGDMALAWALQRIEADPGARLTTYAEHLARFPPTREAEIHERTSWSCAHGVERWRSDCGCCTGGKPGWNQRWRGPLREALDWLRDAAGPLYEQHAKGLLRDPWAARDAYIEVVLDRSPANVGKFLEAQAARQLSQEEQVRALKLLELQRHAMLMYTSCGWFFDELSGIETVQVVQYAGRVIQLAEELSGQPFEAQFLERLAKAPSNVPEHGDGARIYRKFVKPAMVDLAWVASHYAVSSLFEAYGDTTRVYCYDVEHLAGRTLASGRRRLAVGRVRVRSRITREEAEMTYLVLHLGDHNLHGGVRRYQGQETYDALVDRVAGAFGRSDLPAVIRIVDQEFGGGTYSLRSLFRDEQRKILGTLLEATLDEVEAVYRQTYERHAPLMRFLSDMGAPLPKAFRATAEFVLNHHLRRALATDPLDAAGIVGMLEDARREGVELDKAGLAFALRGALHRLAEGLAAQPGEAAALAALEEGVDVAIAMPFEVDVWRVQNLFYEVLRSEGQAQAARAKEGDPAARSWLAKAAELGRKLNVRVEP